VMSGYFEVVMKWHFGAHRRPDEASQGKEAC